MTGKPDRDGKTRRSKRSFDKENNIDVTEEKKERLVLSVRLRVFSCRAQVAADSWETRSIACSHDRACCLRSAGRTWLLYISTPGTTSSCSFVTRPAKSSHRSRFALALTLLVHFTIVKNLSCVIRLVESDTCALTIIFRF